MKRSMLVISVNVIGLIVGGIIVISIIEGITGKNIFQGQNQGIQQENEAIEESMKSTYYELGYTDGYIRKTLDNKKSTVHIDRVLSKAREDYEKRKANDGYRQKNIQ